jgi:hypothetical protein
MYILLRFDHVGDASSNAMLIYRRSSNKVVISGAKLGSQQQQLNPAL